MLVLYENKLWNLEMSFALFENLKKTSPKMKVLIIESTASMYKSIKKPEIGELEDYSIVRNKCALGKT
jgi:hypothetical protein